MFPTLIGISGRSGSGKDTFGNLLRAKLGHTAVIGKFANLLKKISELMLDVRPGSFEKEDFKKIQLPKQLQQTHSLQTRDENTKPMWTDSITSHDYRWFLQTLGTEVGRHIHPDFWIWAFFNSCNPDKTIIITDVRFKNEAEEIKKRGGIMIRIENPKQPKQLYLYSTPHPSETDLDDYKFDVVIQNTGSIAELSNKAIALVNSLSIEPAA